MKSLKKNCLAKRSFIVPRLTENLESDRISEKEYDHVLKVWNKFEIKDYNDLHLKCYVLLLADVFETFRNNSLNNYGLCPSHYLSVPSLNWDAMLKN